MRFYDALSVDNPSNCYNTPEWVDGVKVDADHAHLAYRLINDQSREESELGRIFTETAVFIITFILTLSFLFLKIYVRGLFYVR